MSDYPASAWGYDGLLHLERVSPGEWRAFRLGKARKLGTHTKAEWVVLRDSIGRCLDCGATNIRLAKDHIIPIAKGGCDCIHNLQPLCDPCNSRKGAKI